MKIAQIVLILLTVVFFGACQSDSVKNARLMGQQNPKSVVAKAKESALERKNKIELAKIDAQTKIEVEKIKANKDVEVTKLKTQTQKELGIRTAATQLELKKIDAKREKENSYLKVIVAVFFGLIVLIILYVWSKHKKKKLELEILLEKERLIHNKELKERELQEQRLHKMIDLAADGKLPKEFEEKLLLQFENEKKGNSKRLFRRD